MISYYDISIWLNLASDDTDDIATLDSPLIIVDTQAHLEAILQSNGNHHCIDNYKHCTEHRRGHV
jgi:hypothetical protein